MRCAVWISVVMVLASCQEEVFPVLRNQETIPIIEAIWTDNPAHNQVMISYSRDYYDTLANQIEKEAEVSIVHKGSGYVVPFQYVEDFGKYLPQRQVVGRRGEEYLLRVRIGDNLYEAEGTLLEPPLLDSITHQYREAGVFSDEGYYITVFGKIPFEQDNYYRVKITKNDTLQNSRQDYLLFDDSFGTSILDNGFELGGFAFAAGDRVKLEMFRLNRSAFDFLNDLVALLFNDGGLFSPPPQNPRTNIRVVEGGGRVSGYFMIGPVLTESIIIDVDQ